VKAALSNGQSPVKIKKIKTFDRKALHMRTFLFSPYFKGEYVMTRMTLSTLIVLTSSMCLGFTDQGSRPTSKQECAIEEGNPIDDSSSAERPILEKCKKKKK
jgi:hypothetical protein